MRNFENVTTPTTSEPRSTADATRRLPSPAILWLLLVLLFSALGAAQAFSVPDLEPDSAAPRSLEVEVVL